MKRIGIDARLVRQTGVGTYIQNLIFYLPHDSSVNVKIIVFCLPDDRDFVRSLHPGIHIKSTKSRWHSIEEQIEFLKAIEEEQVDLMHFTYFSYPILYWRPYIATVHDTTPLQFKTGRSSTRNCLVYHIKHLVFQLMLARQILGSKAIITPTITIKETLISLYGKAIQDKVHSIYEGVSYVYCEKKTNAKTAEYYLYVGNYYPHKNVDALIKAFLETNTSKKLILAGPNDYFRKQIQNHISISGQKRIEFVTPHDTNHIAKLYQGAKALIHPSFSEGFGLPLLEAAHFNVPILASDIPVFRELLNESCYYFDPYDLNSIKGAINEFDNEMNPKLPVIQREFSFRQMTKNIFDLYTKYV